MSDLMRERSNMVEQLTEMRNNVENMKGGCGDAMSKES
jgi:hypothetical protein